MHKTQLRLMQLEDYDAVLALWQDSSGMTLREADSRQNIGAYLAKNPGLSFVVEADGQLLGAVLVGTDGRRGYLQHLAVRPSAQGRGVGRTLVQAAIDALADQGIAKTHLFVHTDNPSAQAFYDRLGWHPRDEVRMFSFNASSRPDI
ncbi:GNAT family N-acetyltransferase [Pseudaeromonas paramecii]|uniref:GNAT family N-acetyltransferase n=1 Tax=Pseudaeromonas paramecii TaxID=2138166 RepID=A0ABP8QHZ8_9GAMM